MSLLNILLSDIYYIFLFLRLWSKKFSNNILFIKSLVCKLYIIFCQRNEVLLKKNSKVIKG